MRRKVTAVIGVLCLVTLAACGGSDSTSTQDTNTETTAETAAPTAETTAPVAGVSLAGICPDVVTIQTDWNPEIEHGFVYQLVGRRL